MEGTVEEPVGGAVGEAVEGTVGGAVGGAMEEAVEAVGGADGRHNFSTS